MCLPNRDPLRVGNSDRLSVVKDDVLVQHVVDHVEKTFVEKLRISLPVAGSQILAVLSQLPVRIFEPSGEKATDSTSFVCPAKVRISRPVEVEASQGRFDYSRRNKKIEVED